jgi:hypothetical protein
VGIAGCLGDPQSCTHQVANATAGAFNALWDAVTNGKSGPGLPVPYTCQPGSYQLGELTFFASAFFIPGVDEADLALASGVSSAVAADASSVEKLVTLLVAGRSAGVYMIPSAADLQALFDELSVGGTKIQNAYPGQMVKLPDGTTVGIRSTSKSGGPTIDIKLPDDRQLKVHVSQ